MCSLQVGGCKGNPAAGRGYDTSFESCLEFAAFCAFCAFCGSNYLARRIATLAGAMAEYRG